MLTNVVQLITNEPWQVAIELLVIWLCVYAVFRFLKGKRGATVVKGLAVLLVVGTLTIMMLSQGGDSFTRLSFLYDRFLNLLAVLLIVVFQPELRQAMIRIGHVWSFRAAKSQMQTVVEAVTEAVEFLSKSQFGALIAIERDSRLGGLIESGVILDAKINARLLQSIFWPNNPLHDLGVVIRGNRILAASVQFPLAEEGVLSEEFGSRHRAAVGLSMESDCLVVVVSEENGTISLVENGRLDRIIERDRFRAALAERLTPKSRTEESAAESRAVAAPAGPDEKQAA